MDRQTAALDVKKALSETVLLSDGRYGYVFSEVEGRDTWECHICCRDITTERAMLVHLYHPHHKNKMRVSHHPPKNFKKIITKEDGTTLGKTNADSSEIKRGGDKPWEITDSIRPGEPVPPGMEDLVKKTCQLQEALDNHPGPLIGIEYIVELVSAESAKAEPKYICLLCEKRGDPRSLMVHLSSHNHSLRYISCFFRTAGNAINMIPKVRENRKGVAMAVHKISEEIEKHFGRLKPVTAVAETFAQQKYEILRSIDEQEHFRETPLTTFIQYCTSEKIKEYSKLAEAEFQAVKNKVAEEGGDKTFQANDRPENINEKCVPAQQKAGINEKFMPTQRGDTKPATSPGPASKLSFSIGKPKRSFGQNNKTTDSKDGEKKDDDEVIFVESTNDPIEILSMSSISSESDSESKGAKIRMRSRSRSRSRGRARGRLPLPRRRSPRYRSPISSRDVRYRNRSRSRSRGRYREKERYSRESRAFRESDRIYSRDKRSRSKEREKLRYDRSRSDRDRFRRSISIDRDRRRLSPYKSSKHGKSPDRSPPNRSRLNKSSSPKRKKPTEYESKLDIYRLKLHDLEVEMDNKLKYYKDRPEKHPQYSEEWKNFWNRRYKELQQAGKDPNGYDFKPEWIIFWEERVRNLHEEELLAKKEELKSLLPAEEKGPSSDLQDISPPTPESSKDVTVDDIKNTWKALTGSDIKAPSKTYSPTREDKSPFRRSPSPWEDKNKSLEIKNSKRSTSYVDSPIVHCLRMLSVIEHQLGSLGPKALELLSRAIIMEKVKYNESMLLLQEPDVHIYFETVKEKIRGQLIAHVVARNLVNSCRTLISAIEKLIAANPLKPKPLVQPRSTFVTIKQDPVAEAGGDIVNKMAVAQQIAEILVAQGRTDVTQQELEELINAVVGLASTSNTNANQPPANFIAQLDVQQSTANSQINELLNGLITSAQNSSSSLTQASMPLAISIPEKPQEFLPEINNSFLQCNSKTAPGENATKAFADAVSAVKATVTEHASLLTPVAASVIKDKPLFPIQQPSIENEISKDDKQISDEELKGQLLKFKLLSRDEQQNLILLLKDLEGKEPERVEKLRKYVTLGLTTGSGSKADSDSGRLSPFSSRAGGTNPAPEEKSKPNLVECMSESDRDDDDDDYTVEDIYKSVSEKLRKKESERKKEFRINPEELDENSSSSRQSFINPPKELSSQSIDLRNNYPSSQQPKSDYSVYSVNEPLDKYSRPLDHINQASTENSYKSSQWQNKNWDGSNSGNSVKSWPQNPIQDMYSVGRNTSYPGGGQYENSSYSSLMPPPFVKNLPSGGQFYSNEPDPSLMSMQHPPNEQYSPSTTQFGNTQNFQNPMYNNEAGPGYNNYQKMNQPYYRPY